MKFSISFYVCEPFSSWRLVPIKQGLLYIIFIDDVSNSESMSKYITAVIQISGLTINGLFT